MATIANKISHPTRLARGNMKRSISNGDEISGGGNSHHGARRIILTQGSAAANGRTEK